MNIRSCLPSVAFHLLFFILGYIIESCVGWVNPHGLEVPAFVGQVREPAKLCMQVQAQDKKFLLQVTDI